MTHEPDSTYNDANSYDDRNVPMSEDAPRSTYAPIEERPENTHMQYSEADPAIDESDPVAIFE